MTRYNRTIEPAETAYLINRRGKWGMILVTTSAKKGCFQYRHNKSLRS